MTKSLSGYLTASVDEILDDDVIVASVAFDNRADSDGKGYTQTTITLDDGRRYRSSSAVVADILGRIPPEDFPVGPLAFVKHPSTRKGMADYVAVESRDAE